MQQTHPNDAHPLNVHVYGTEVTPYELRALQNTIGLHIYPSARAGFGHLINEGRAASALVVTTDVAPLNELITEQTGVLITAASPLSSSSSSSGAGMRTAVSVINEWGALSAEVTDEAMQSAVEKVLRMTVGQRRNRGQEARKGFDADTAFFQEKMRTLASYCS